MKLADELAKIVSEHGLTYKELATRADVDRTTLSKVINGQRRPNEEFIEKICEAIFLPTMMREGLKDKLEAERVGEDIYRQHCSVKELIERVGAESLIAKPPRQVTERVTQSSIEGEVYACTGAYAVDQLVSGLMRTAFYNKQTECIKTTCPFRYTHLFNVINELHEECGDATSVEHLISLKSKSSNSNAFNVERMRMLLPYALSGNRGYHAYYYFIEKDVEMNRTLPYAYYIILSGKVLLINESFDAAMLVSNQDAVNVYNSRFDEIKHISERVTIEFQTPFEALQYEYDIDGYGRHEVTHIMYEPAMCYGYTPEELVAHARTENPQIAALAEVAYKRYKYMQSFENQRLTQFFTIEGLEAFLEEGYSNDYPREIMRPFTLEERLTFLQRFIKSVDSEAKIRIINPARFKMSKYCTIRLNAYRSVIFTSYTQNLESMRMVRIREESVVGAFTEFVEYLPQSRFVFSKDETMHILRKQESNLQERINANKS